MENMYERIDRLCKDNRTNITIMCRELEISRSALSELKAGRSKTLSAVYLQKIADHLGTSVTYLMDGKHPTPTPITVNINKGFVKNYYEITDPAIGKQISKYLDLDDRGRRVADIIIDAEFEEMVKEAQRIRENSLKNDESE